MFRNDGVLLFSFIPFLTVIAVCKLLSCVLKFPRTLFTFGQMMKTSSIYLIQQVGLRLKLPMVFFSKLIVKMLTMTSESGEINNAVIVMYELCRSHTVLYKSHGVRDK